MKAEEPLHDKSQTMVTVGIPEGVEAAAMKRELAYLGFHVVKTKFDHNPITNERSGKGTIQVRAANPRYHEELKKEIEKIGLKMTKSTKSQPNRNITWK